MQYMLYIHIQYLYIGLINKFNWVFPYAVMEKLKQAFWPIQYLYAFKHYTVKDSKIGSLAAVKRM